MKEFFTTSEVSEICGIAANTVVKYCDENKIANIKAPITNRRRIPRDGLLKFLREHGISDSAIEDYETRTVLVADDDPEVLAVMTMILKDAFQKLEVVTVTNGYDDEARPISYAMLVSTVRLIKAEH